MGHYVESHAVRTPETLVRHLSSRAYTPPTQGEVDAEEGRRVHQRMWESILPLEE